MKLAKLAFLVTLLMSALMVSVTAQTLRTERDPRNTAPTVGTGGTVGGPTGLFTVYDGTTLRKGEWTLSAAYSNFDRDPGNVDLTEVPLSFQIGLNDYLEIFFTTDGFRALKVNARRHLSSNYLPNSQFFLAGGLRSGPAVVMAPQGTGTSQYPGWAIFRPTGTQPFVQFPYVGGSAGNYQFSFNSGGVFGFPAGSIPTLGPPRAGGATANFPGIGSVYGSILPGIVLSTTTIPSATVGTNAPSAEVPLVFTTAPTYLPDAPFINRGYGTSAFGTFSAGAKWRWTKPNNPVGVGLVGYYQWYADKATDLSGWNQLQRGASAGGNKGDIALILFGDVRARKWMNISANLGYKYTSAVKGDFPTGEFTILDRPDELYSAFAVDFPVNKYFQPILEFRSTQYVGGRTPNAFENSPMDGIAGVRIYPTRWMSIGAAYRYHFNQQDADSFDGSFNGTVTVAGRVPTVINTRISGVPQGFSPSLDPHGFIFQFTAGRRNKREQDVQRPFANVESVQLSNTTIVIPCPPGTTSTEPCPEGNTVNVGTKASSNDPADVLVYNYTVSGGRIVGSGANVTWDLSGVRPGTYTITAGVDNGCGVCGTTKTETITVKNCEGCQDPCVCPTVGVSGGGVVKPGEPMIFRANVSGGSSARVQYNWNVSAGRIISGEGTDTITVSTEGLEDTSITATVDIGQQCKTDCVRTASETGSVAGIVRPRLIDEFGKLPADEVKARVDALYIALGNEPNSQGYIINYGTPREVAAREKQIRDAISFRKYDASRVTIVNGGANPNGAGVLTKFWIVPPGAANPEP